MFETTIAERSSGPTILLVDDNAQNLRVLYETLLPERYRLLLANSGEKALSLVMRELPDLILLDIMMPHMDGYEVCRHLQENPQTASIPVIYLSALNDVDAKIKGFNLGAVDFIEKPFYAQEVLARVRTHLRIRQLESQLRQQNQMLALDNSNILANMAEAIYGLDKHGTIRFANPAAAAFNRCDISALIGKNLFSLHFAKRLMENGAALPVAGASLMDDYLPLAGLQSKGRILDFPVDHSPDRPIEYRLTITRDIPQSGGVFVFHDISDEIAREHALSQAQQQLAHVSRLSMMGEMAASFAHELNQPLTAISNYSNVTKRQLQKLGEEASDLATTLDKIEAQAKRASEVIERIRGFVKKPKAEMVAYDLDQLIRETLSFAEVDIRRYEGSVLLASPPVSVQVQMDKVQFQQVMLNLIRNALEANAMTGQQMPVVIKREIQEGDVKISVQDQGPGLSPDIADQLFHPFVTTKEKGMGVGLAICKTIIQSSGGTIGYEPASAEGGASFYICLPANDV